MSADNEGMLREVRKMTVCPKCFAEIPDTSVFCLECGARIREDTTDSLYAEGSDREVYPEIARANLLRMKGEYEQAIEICLSILRRFPSNETAHALLGDIYADQGKLDDAIQWYELLVELAPNNAVYSAKLMNLRSMRAAQMAPPPPVELPDTPQPVRAPAPKVWVYALFSLLALILIVAAFVAGLRWNLQQAQQASETPSTPKPAESAVVPPPSQPVQSQPPVSVPPPPVETGNLATGMSEGEARLARVLSQQLKGLPVWCTFDVLSQRWHVRIRLQGGALTRPRIMQEALATARAFFEQSPTATGVVITVLVPSSTGGDNAVFAAEIPREVVAQAPAELTDEQVGMLFQPLTVWWNTTVGL